MKWLLLAVLVGCGNHTPKGVDLSDSDGDSIPNYKEEQSGTNPYIADIQSMKTTKGKLSFEEKGQQLEFDFTNKSDVKADIVTLLTSASTQEEELFYEWTKLNFTEGKVLPSLQYPLYDVQLSFDDVPEGHVLLTTENEQKDLGPSGKGMNLAFTKEELVCLLNKSCRLELTPSPKLERVRQSTYRIFFIDDEGPKILYVAKKYPFAKFLNARGVTKVRSFKPGDFLQGTMMDQKTWWNKEFPNGDEVLVHASANALKKDRLSRMKKVEGSLERKEGKGAALTIIKDQDEVLYLHLSGTTSIRTFATKIGAGGCKVGLNDTLGYWANQRYVAGVTSYAVTADQITESLSINVDGREVAPSRENGIDVGYGGTGEMIISTPGKKVELALRDIPETKFVVTGDLSIREYMSPTNAHCVLAPDYTSPEVNFELNVETYVEKTR